MPDMRRVAMQAAIAVLIPGASRRNVIEPPRGTQINQGGA